MITFDHLSKRYGDAAAVDDVTAELAAGTVTGLLGPNGAGKTTTMRVQLGLSDPTSGTALVGGHRYRDLPWPLRTVGATLDTAGAHPRRSGQAHLLAIAASSGLPRTVVDFVLDRVDLRDVGSDHVGSYSHGMTRRLVLAAALLGDPPVLVLDEPFDGSNDEQGAWTFALSLECYDRRWGLSEAERHARRVGSEGAAAQPGLRDPTPYCDAVEVADPPGRAAGCRPCRLASQR